MREQRAGGKTMSDKYFMEHSASETEWINWFKENEKGKHEGTQSTIDLVVLQFINNKLQVLLGKRVIHPYKDDWTLPGSYIHNDEDFLDTVHRIFKEKLQTDYSDSESRLVQLATYSGKNRDPRGRVISTAYLVYTYQQFNFSGYEWKPLIEASQQPNLAFDHANILYDAFFRIKDQFSWKPQILFSLGNAEGFGLGDIVKLKAYLYGQDYRQINRANLRKKMLPYLTRVSKGTNQKVLYRFVQGRDLDY